MFFHFVTKHACYRWTDRQNYDPRDCASIGASRSKNEAVQKTHGVLCSLAVSKYQHLCTLGSTLCPEKEPDCLIQSNFDILQLVVIMLSY